MLPFFRLHGEDEENFATMFISSKRLIAMCFDGSGVLKKDSVLTIEATTTLTKERKVHSEAHKRNEITGTITL